MTDVKNIRESSQATTWVEMLNELKGVSANLYDDNDETIILGEVAKSLEGHKSETGYINDEYDYLAFCFDVNDRASFGDSDIKGTWLEVLLEIKNHVFAKLILPDNPERPRF